MHLSLFSELHRRNVIRVVAAYLAAAWLLIQIADTVIPAFSLPESALTILIITLAIGLLPTVVISWAFQWTRHGLKRDAQAAPAESFPQGTVRRIDRTIMVMLALGLAYFAFDKFALSASREAAIAQLARQEGRNEALVKSYGRLSVAVLPFANLSSDPEQSYFSDGLAEELLNLLARVPQLRVTSRSSAFAFRGNDIDIQEVAGKLKVAHVLEGSVRKSGNDVRITVKLIDAQTDTSLWSETFDRPIDDIFAVQDEVARHVVAGIQPALLGNLPRTDRVNPQAYSLYLQARQINKLRQAEQYLKAKSMLNQALTLAPDYVDALVELMTLYSVNPGADLYEVEDLDTLYEETRRRALSLDPGNINLKLAMGWQLGSSAEELAESARIFMEVLAVDPNNAEALLGMATLAGDLGRTEQSISVLEYLSERDPLNIWVYQNLGQAYANAGRYEDSLNSIAIALDLNPSSEGNYWNAGLVKLLAGDPAGALKEFQLEPHAPYRLQGMALALHDLGRSQESASTLKQLLEFPDIKAQWPHGLARLYAWLGDADQAFHYLELTAASYPGMLVNASFNPLYSKLYDDPRWSPFLTRIGFSPEQLDRIKLEFRLP